MVYRKHVGKTFLEDCCIMITVQYDVFYSAITHLIVRDALPDASLAIRRPNLTQAGSLATHHHAPTQGLGH